MTETGFCSDAKALETFGLTDYATHVIRVLLSHGLRCDVRPQLPNGGALIVRLDDRREFRVPLNLDTPELHEEVRRTILGSAGELTERVMTESIYQYSVEDEGYTAIRDKQPLEKRHPQQVILDNFPDAHSFKAIAMSGAWWFTATRREGELPPFFSEVERYPGPVGDAERTAFLRSKADPNCPICGGRGERDIPPPYTSTLRWKKLCSCLPKELQQ
jgi:hypothetical protein